VVVQEELKMHLEVREVVLISSESERLKNLEVGEFLEIVGAGSEVLRNMVSYLSKRSVDIAPTRRARKGVSY